MMEDVRNIFNPRKRKISENSAPESEKKVKTENEEELTEIGDDEVFFEEQEKELISPQSPDFEDIVSDEEWSCE